MKINNTNKKKPFTILFFASLIALLLAMTTTQQQEVFGTSSSDSEYDDTNTEVEEEEVEEEEVEDIKEESNEDDYAKTEAKDEKKQDKDKEQEIVEVRDKDKDKEPAKTDSPQQFKHLDNYKKFKTLNVPSQPFQKTEHKEESTGDSPQPFKIYKEDEEDIVKIKPTMNSPSFKIEDKEPAKTGSPQQFKHLDNYKKFKTLNVPSQPFQKTEHKEESTGDSPQYALGGSLGQIVKQAEQSPIGKTAGSPQYALGGSLGKFVKQAEQSPIGKVGGDILETTTGGRGINDIKNSQVGQIVKGGLSCGIVGCNNPATMSGGSGVKSGEAVLGTGIEEIVNDVDEAPTEILKIPDNIVDEYKRTEENVKDEYKRTEENVKDEYKRTEENAKEVIDKGNEIIAEKVADELGNVADKTIGCSTRASCEEVIAEKVADELGNVADKTIGCSTRASCEEVIAEKVADELGNIANDTFGCSSEESCKEVVVEKVRDELENIANDTIGCVSMEDCKEELRKQFDFSLNIPYAIPAYPQIGGNIHLAGNLLDMEKTDTEIRFMGFIIDGKLPSDYTITQVFDADIVPIVMDMFPNLKATGDIDLKTAIGYINQAFGTNIADTIVEAKLKLTFIITFPIPQSLNDVSSIQKMKEMTPEISVMLDGCFSDFSGGGEGILENCAFKNMIALHA